MTFYDETHDKTIIFFDASQEIRNHMCFNVFCYMFDTIVLKCYVFVVFCYEFIKHASKTLALDRFPSKMLRNKR